MAQLAARKRNGMGWGLILAPLLLAGCGTTMSGHVVKPDGSRLTEPNVVVYTSPRTESVRVGKDGAFKLGKNVIEENEYTLIAEDKDGNMGYVRSFKPKKGSNKNIVVRLSREIDGKDAVMEGGPNEGNTTGLGEKILKSSP
ncbi:MAG TPA: hypothetical protein VJ385_11285 [Fibrobacteria bacterium]|nr:hypothetical protein [Fibrobacteria bacterium]